MKLPAFLATLLFTSALLAAEKQVPPPGVKIPDADRRELESGAALLARDIESLRTQPKLAPLLPDVEVFHKAVHDALAHDEFFDLKQVGAAKNALKEGAERARALRGGNAPWLTMSGVRGYRSRIDGSVQPYSVVVPASWKAGDKSPRPLWLWMHGRGENLSELAFIAGKPAPDLDPGNGFFVKLYGRFCNANKFAGETDLFETMEAVRRFYPVDPQRIVVCGFSMGGASTWHIAAHHAGLWAAASPGAGFADTAVYGKVFAEGKEPPPWWEQVLWRFYDATDYASNLANTSLVAYSGEIDPQKASADLMEKVMAGEGLKLERFIGPNTAHKYEPNTKKDLEKRLGEIAAKGRDPSPAKVHLTTYTLRYNRMNWVNVDALERHWLRADVDAAVAGDRIVIKTRNVAALRFFSPFDTGAPASERIRQFEIDGTVIPAAWNKAGAQFHKENGAWKSGPVTSTAPRKTHGLTGPVDDAFMDSFIFVRPTGKPLHERVGAWSKSEMERAMAEWRRVFRGDAPVKNDTSITAADIANSNLVLWGDPASNAVLAKILPKLPIRWDAATLAIGDQKFNAIDHAPILIFPNPLNPNRYVVINSGFTFREGSAQSNAQQTPKLPDWAIVDLRTPPDAHLPGGVAGAGFFGEQWQVEDNSALKDSVRKN